MFSVRGVFCFLLIWLAGCSTAIRIPTELPLNQAESTLVSPDNQWTAYFYPEGVAQLIVVNAHKKDIWRINEGIFADQEASFQPYRWSSDSQILYFTTYRYIDGAGPFYHGAGLRSIDIRTGKTSEVLSSGDISVKQWKIVDFSISPADETLAYVDFDSINSETLIVIRDMVTGEEANLSLQDDCLAGSFVWSPINDKLAFASYTTDRLGYAKITLTEINLATFTPTVLIQYEVQDEKSFMLPVEWTSDNTLVLRTLGGETYILNLVNDEITSEPVMSPPK